MIVITIWPLFGLIVLGYVLGRRGYPDPAFWAAAEKINYTLLFPALLIASLGAAPLRDPAIWRLGGAAVCTVALAALALWLWRGRQPAARFGPTVQGVIRFNTYLGLAITASLTGAEGITRAAIVLAVVVPLVNVLSILALAAGPAARRPRAMLAMMARNPLIIACALGITAALSGIDLPHGTGAFFALLGQGSLPLGLLCVGAALRVAGLRADRRAITRISLIRLLVMPLLAAAMARLFGLGAVESLVLVIFFAIPTAPTAYVLTRQMGGDGPLMAGLVTAQTLAAVLTIPLILLMLGAG